ncbi:hypothetical protein SMKI_12G3230 [Saccharomyces mikatae IFO 1815]|uniref:Uncharacterized protein n=1 Tax=Saccharomyces mikatae IFO 1815 TaxID=226126 RepID=A0AA35ND68_SACMI|nr:uncharacterized protein SMKI_12G3230 [Saccharomyces mikatae IFO 1815]CAI4035177.1 hypothetical protein SMKI_12G3230 [Saccharomyces mikatae IFO 1815]
MNVIFKLYLSLDAPKEKDKETSCRIVSSMPHRLTSNQLILKV